MIVEISIVLLTALAFLCSQWPHWKYIRRFCVRKCIKLVDTICIHYIHRNLPFSFSLALFLKRYHPPKRPPRFEREQRLQQCIICGATENLKLCSGCWIIPFCSQTCQKRYWPVHRDSCKRFQKYRDRHSQFCQTIYANGSFQETMVEICELKLLYPPLRKKITNGLMTNVLSRTFLKEIKEACILSEAVFNAMVLPVDRTLGRVKELLQSGQTLHQEFHSSSYDSFLDIGPSAILVLLMFRNVNPDIAGLILDLDMKVRRRKLEALLPDFTEATCAIIAAYASYVILELEGDNSGHIHDISGLGVTLECMEANYWTRFPESNAFIRIGE